MCVCVCVFFLGGGWGPGSEGCLTRERDCETKMVKTDENDEKLSKKTFEYSKNVHIYIHDEHDMIRHDKKITQNHET